MNAAALSSLSAQLAALLPGLAVEQVDEIASTNTELMGRARAGDTSPVLLVAARQTAGRGRVGRGWDSAPGDSLTFSLSLPLAPADWSGLSLAVGVSVAESLDADGAARVQLKWPNDLWRQDRKLGGILIETAGAPGGRLAGPGAARQVVIGIGLNLAERPAEGLRTAPAAVREWWPGAGPDAVLARIAPALVAEVLRFERAGFAPVAPRFAVRDALRGREVVLSDGTAGLCEGVGAGGELLVRTAAGVQPVTSAEVSARPRGMPPLA